jgi:hypothetical protein
VVEPYFWDPTFDLQLLPFQDTDPVQVAEEPQGPLTPVTATNYAELVAALNTPNTEVTFTGRIENPVFADGNIIDVHLILADGALIKSPTFGAADGSCTINRFLVSSPNLGEPGTPGVTGQIHQASFFAPATNVVFDGVIMSGPGGNAGALIFNNTTGHTNDKLAVNFCLAACGGYFYIGTASNFTMVKTSARTGIDTVSQLEAWGTRNAHETLGNIVGFECDLRSSQNRINQAYHRWRIHPDNGLLNFWFGYGVLIDRVESRIAWCNRNAGGVPDGPQTPRRQAPGAALRVLKGDPRGSENRFSVPSAGGRSGHANNRHVLRSTPVLVQLLTRAGKARRGDLPDGRARLSGGQDSRGPDGLPDRIAG